MKYLLIIIFTIGAFSQNHTAQDLLDQAYENIKRLSDPQLLFVGTAPDQDFEIFQTSFDLNSGKSNFWIYAFGENNDLENLEFVLIADLPFIGVTDIRNLDPNGDLEAGFQEGFSEIADIPVPDGWVDSDVFANNLTQYSYFQSLRGQYADIPMEFIGLSAGEVDGSLDVFWAIGYSNEAGEGFQCYMSNLNQIVECEEAEVNRIIDLINIGAKVGPNPTRNSFTIELDNVQQASNISLVDLLGNIIIPDYTLNSNKIFIETSNLEPGTYILSVEISNKIYTTKVVKF